MGKEQSLIKKKDFTTPEALAELEREEKEVREARRLARIQAEKEAEEKRKKDAEELGEYQKYVRQKYKKKQESPLYKPSRMINIDSDLQIMNTAEDVASIKETVEHIDQQLDELSDFLYRTDKTPWSPQKGKKHDSFEMKKLKRKQKR